MLNIEFLFNPHIFPYLHDRLHLIYLRKNAASLAGLIQPMVHRSLPLQIINLLPWRSLADGIDFHFRKLGTRQSEIPVLLPPVWPLDHHPSHHWDLILSLPAAPQPQVVWIKVKRRRKIERRRKTAEIVYYRSIADLEDGMAGVESLYALVLHTVHIWLRAHHDVSLFTTAYSIHTSYIHQ